MPKRCFWSPFLTIYHIRLQWWALMYNLSFSSFSLCALKRYHLANHRRSLLLPQLSDQSIDELQCCDVMMAMTESWKLRGKNGDASAADKFNCPKCGKMASCGVLMSNLSSHHQYHQIHICARGQLCKLFLDKSGSRDATVSFDCIFVSVWFGRLKAVAF